MSDKILLYCRKKCETCKGSGREHELNFEDERYENKYKGDKCSDCTEGYTDIVMELKWTGHSFDYRPDNEGDIRLYILRFEPNGSLFICTFDKNGKYIGNVTESINPTHLEVITLKECPECIDHPGREISITRPEYAGVESLNQPCSHCTDGKIEVVTQFTVFDSKDEYDNVIRSEFVKKIAEFIPIGTIKLISKERLGNALANINNIVQRTQGG